MQFRFHWRLSLGLGRILDLIQYLLYGSLVGYAMGCYFLHGRLGLGRDGLGLERMADMIWHILPMAKVDLRITAPGAQLLTCVSLAHCITLLRFVTYSF